MKHDNKKNIALLIVLAVLLISGIHISLLIGRFPIPLNPFLWDARTLSIIKNIRLPRILLSCLVGASLSAAGVTYQSIFKNPMAAPDLLGASAGSAFGASIAIMLRLPAAGITGLAFCTGLVTIMMVMTIGSHAKGDKLTSLILAGIIISSLFSGGTSCIKLVADPTDQLPAITYWLMGSVSSTVLKDAAHISIPIGIGLVLIFFLKNQLDALTLDEDEALSIGVNTTRMRIIFLLLATLVTAASVAVSGNISWVGLVIPHIVRRITGNRNRILVPASILFGAFFLLMIDNLSRTLFTTEIPLGILTSFIGAPVFMTLIISKRQDPK